MKSPSGRKTNEKSWEEGETAGKVEKMMKIRRKGRRQGTGVIKKQRTYFQNTWLYVVDRRIKKQNLSSKAPEL